MGCFPDRVGEVTAEPRMEDLLASIRKAINEDIGGEAVSASSSHSETASASPRAPARETAGRHEEPSATSSEIQQLRDKISRSRTREIAAPRDPAQRAASLAAALRSETPRRAWRDLEPQQPPPRLRTSILEPEAPRPALRPEVVVRPAPRLTADRPPQAPPRPVEEALALPREPERAPAPRADQAPILSGGSAQAVQSAFSRLADTVLARATGERSIEEMTRELLRVMLKQWLDDHLPQLVERLVREEIERVARTGR